MIDDDNIIIMRVMCGLILLTFSIAVFENEFHAVIFNFILAVFAVIYSYMRDLHTQTNTVVKC